MRKGSKMSAEQRAKISRANKGHVASAATRAKMSAAKTIHGIARTAEYRAWRQARERCYNPSNNRYYRYGALGVRMCDEWLHDPAAFAAYVGPRPSPRHSIDRIDPWGDYQPGNVRWATRFEQARNTRRNFNREMHISAHGLINAILHPLAA